MTTYAPPARIPQPEIFEAAILLGCLFRPYVEWHRFTEDVTAVNRAVKRLAADFGITIAWIRGPDATLHLEPLDGMSLVGTHRHLFDLIRKQTNWINRVGEGVGPNLKKILAVSKAEALEREKSASAPNVSTSKDGA